MWPFTRKIKKKTELPVIDLREFVKRKFPCPPVQLETRACVCIDCPKRGPCFAERLFASSRQCHNTFVKACTVTIKEGKSIFEEDLTKRLQEEFGVDLGSSTTKCISAEKGECRSCQEK